MAKIYFNNYGLELARAKIFKSLEPKKQLNIFDVLELSSGDYLPKTKMEDGKHIVYGGGGLTNATHKEFNVKERTLGIGRVGARCGCCFIIEPKSWVTDNALFISKLKQDYDYSFLMHYLNHLDLNKFANQSAQPVISQRGIAKCTIPDIDIKKQEKIAFILNAIEKGKEFDDIYDLHSVLKIEKNLSILQEELTLQQTHLQQLRQAILQEAVQGKLTSPSPSERGLGGEVDEPASKLLQRIKAEKQKLIAAGKLKKEKELPPITKGEIPFELPKGWVWCRLGEVIEFTENVTIETKFSPSTIINYVDIDSIDNKNYLIREVKQKAVSELSSRARRVLKKGFIVYSLVRPYLDNIAVVEDERKNYIGSTGFAVFKGIFIENRYLKTILLSEYIRKLYLEMLSGFNSPGISQSQFISTLIPLPPLAEQQRIVTKVQQLLQMLKQLEEQIIHSQTQAEQLLQAVLKEAFSSPSEASAQKFNKNTVYKENESIMMAAEPEVLYRKTKKARV